MKVGVIGLGAMGRNHARVLSNMESVSELALYDPMGSTLGSVSGLEVSSSLDSFLDQDIDYCVISSPTGTHRDLGLVLASKGIPSLIEKPLASNSTEAREIADEFHKQNLLGAVGHIERYNPAIIALHRQLEAGVLGEIYQITTRRVGPFSGRIRDVGVVKDLASHDIDTVSWLSNSRYMSANSQILFPRGNEFEDCLLTLAKMDNGILVQHTVNWISPSKERSTTFLGANGVLTADSLNGDLYLHLNGTETSSWGEMAQLKGLTEGSITKFEIRKEEPLLAEHLAFQKALLNGDRSEIVSLHQGVYVLEVADMFLNTALRAT